MLTVFIIYDLYACGWGMLQTKLSVDERSLCASIDNLWDKLEKKTFYPVASVPSSALKTNL
jgi:hypothetical protein